MIPLWSTTICIALGFQQKVDLGDWTSYLDLHPAQYDTQSSIALLEARSPDDRDAFLTSARDVPQACQVHVSAGLILLGTYYMGALCPRVFEILATL